MLALEFLFVVAVLYFASKFDTIGLAAISGLGLLVEVFIFRMPPSHPPITVMLIIMAVVTCAAILEASGGLKYMLQVTEKILRANPKYIVFLGPISTYFLTFLIGTGHAVYTLMPIIADITLKNNIRPERAMVPASLASQLAITASPISAAVVYTLTELTKIGMNVSLIKILMVTVPATFIGTIVMCFYSLKRGKELNEDPDYQKRLQDPEWKSKIESFSHSILNEKLPASAKRSVLLFISGIIVVSLLALFPSVRTIADKEIDMAVIVQMIMLSFGGLILITCDVKASAVSEGKVFRSGMLASLAIFGIAWMTDTYFSYAMPLLKSSITDVVKANPWTFGLAMFFVSILIHSQAATIKMMLPVGIGLGLPASVLVGLMPSSYAYFFIAVYPSDIATASFDVTGTTKITGKYFLNHSFMVPGLLGVFVACVVGYTLGSAMF